MNIVTIFLLSVIFFYILQSAAHQRELEKLALLHKGEIENRNESHVRLINEKEREIRNQRERTIALLADKDKEIKQLKAYTSTYRR